MAQGVPVVAADSPGLRDTVGDAAALVPATDPAAWADALARCVGDPLLRRTLVERGRAHAARFRWDDSADRYLALYRQVLGR
jgi:glycosyltransferase involved in cell wall biosynthesis